MKPTVVSLALAVRMGSVAASVNAAVPCRMRRRERWSRAILLRFMSVLLLPAGIAVSLMAGRPGEGDNGRSWGSRTWGVLASFGDFARVMPAGRGGGCAAIMLKSLDFPGNGISGEGCAAGRVPKKS